MRKTGKWTVAIMLLALVSIVPVNKADAANGKARLLEITRGNYNDAKLNLSPGPENDGKNIHRVLKEAYQQDLVYAEQKTFDGVTTVEGVKASIQKAYADAQNGDVNYFYYSGHGTARGINLSNNVIMTAEDLAAAFENIKGTNFIIMDCCYSGAMAERTARSVTDASEEFIDNFVDAFAAAVEPVRKSRSALTNSRFKLLMASAKEEVSWQISYGDLDLGCFSSVLSYGAGVDPAKVQENAGYSLAIMAADYDRNGEIALGEMQRYIENTYQYAANHVRSYPAEDSSCFLPVPQGKIPAITFERAVVDSRSKNIQISYHSGKEESVDYVIYTGKEDLMGTLISEIYARSSFNRYSNLTTVDVVSKGMIAQDANGTFTVPVKAWTDGNYYILLQGKNQALRYFLPFRISNTEDISLKNNFSIKLSGSQYTENVFQYQEGAELQISADFGTTNNQETAKPYVSCRILKERDRSLVKILGEKELMQIVGTGTTEFTSGNCYRLFYWNGTNSAGNLMASGNYIIQITAEGAVNATKEMTFTFQSPLSRVAQVKEINLLSTDFSFPVENRKTLELAEIVLDYNGKLAVQVYKGSQLIALILPESEVFSGRNVIAWDGSTSAGIMAEKGDYTLRVEYSPDNGMEPTEVTKDFYISDPPVEAKILEHTGANGIDFLNGEQWECSFTVNKKAIADMRIQNAAKEDVARWEEQDVLPGVSYQVSWDGKDTYDQFVKDGEYTLYARVYNLERGIWEVFSEDIKIIVGNGVSQPESIPADRDVSLPPQQQMSQTIVEVSDITVKVNGKQTEAPKLGKGEKAQLAVGVFPNNASNKEVQYHSSNQKAVMVSADGEIRAKAVGKSTVTVTAGKQKKTITVTVKKAPKKIVFTTKKKTIKAGKKLRLRVKLSAGSASSRISYRSSNEEVAVVDASGKLQAVGQGKAVITAKTYNRKKVKISITVQ